MDRTTVDVLCAGETMAMLVPEHAGPPSVDSRYRISAAGAESNVASALSRLGFHSAWMSRVGDDPLGEFLVNDIAAAGVDVSRVAVDPTRPTGVALKDRTQSQTSVLYYRAGSAASGLDRSSAISVLAVAPRVIHLSGITPALSTGCAGFVDAIITDRPTGTRVSFDLNWRPSLWPDGDGDMLHDFAQRCDIVFVGLDEALSLWNLDEIDEVRAHLSQPATLIIKRGSAGSTVFHNGERFDVSALLVDVLEPVGAGDAFAAGFLAGMLQGSSPRISARLGTIVASSVLTSLTDTGPLPSDEYIRDLLELPESDWRAHRYDLERAQRSNPYVPNC